MPLKPLNHIYIRTTAITASVSTNADPVALISSAGGPISVAFGRQRDQFIAGEIVLTLAVTGFVLALKAAAITHKHSRPARTVGT